jgi:hypothetical protein
MGYKKFGTRDAHKSGMGYILETICVRKGLVLGLSLACFSLVIADESDRPDPKRSISFDQAKPKVLEDSKQIVAETTGVFEKFTGKQAGANPIQIFVTDHLMSQGQAVRAGQGQVQGVTFYGNDGYIIQISSRRTSSLGRVLAHETTHVLVREVYGKVENTLLSEGFAEYLADQIFPAEVRAQMRATQGKIIPPSMRPYVEGYRFVYNHADDPMFKDFLAVELKNPASSGRDLENRWKEWESNPDALAEKAKKLNTLFEKSKAPVVVAAKQFEPEVHPQPSVQSLQARVESLEPKVYPQPSAQSLPAVTKAVDPLEEDRKFEEES